jgi:hypothetical protein
VEDLEDALDELYERPPAEFVAAREALVRELRADKRRDEARTVHGLARPTLVAWVVNQLARRHPDELGQLAQVGESLRAAQEQALRGGAPGGLRSAAQERREAVARLVSLAEPILDERGTDPSAHVEELTSALDALAVDPDAVAAAQRGRLAKPPVAQSSFGFGFGFEAGAEAGSEAEQPTGGEAGHDDERSGTRQKAGRDEAPQKAGAAKGRSGKAASRKPASEQAPTDGPASETSGRGAAPQEAADEARAGREAEQAAERERARCAVRAAEDELAARERARDEAMEAWRAAKAKVDDEAGEIERLERELNERRARRRDAERKALRLAHELERRRRDVDQAVEARDDARRRAET